MTGRSVRLSELVSRRRERMSCLRCYVAAGILLVCPCGWLLSAQTPGKIDCQRDVQPIFQAHCIGCHGPSQQMDGLRLDRRSSVFRAAFPRVLPGSSETSFLYRKLIGSDYGQQMPPAGPLRPEQMRTIKEWIDQGADWPDELAGEASVAPPDPNATSMMSALRNGDSKALK